MEILLNNSDKLLFNYLDISSRLTGLVSAIANKETQYYDEYLQLVSEAIEERCNLLEVSVHKSIIPIEENLSYTTLQEFHNSILSLMTNKAREVKVGYRLILGLRAKIKQ